MDFYVDLGIAVILRLLKDRRELKKWRAAMLKVATAIIAAYKDDAEFIDKLEDTARPAE